ncbi:MAG: hypothetical protein IJL79_02715 [Candidatus Methanomethylophilaceae archaeon]|nr:hypothetical protein [Candidatus Methanomethylophilaceae archaeon]
MRRVAVRIAYLGKDYSGSQIQPGLRTVMGDVTADLERIGGGRTGEWFDLKAAGRTDKGVNALDNVIVFNTVFDDDEDLLRALNSVSKGIFYRAIATVGVDSIPGTPTAAPTVTSSPRRAWTSTGPGNAPSCSSGPMIS